MMDYGKIEKTLDEIRRFDWIKLIDIYRLVDID